MINARRRECITGTARNFLRGRCPLLAQKRQAVGIFSANALKCRDRVGADAPV